MEGDYLREPMASRVCDFYPRPPGGGRLDDFLRTGAGDNDFYPRPPGGGRPPVSALILATTMISIHALRVEGDVALFEQREILILGFLSTPSGWRATPGVAMKIPDTQNISIHALRVEGDRACGSSARR